MGFTDNQELAISLRNRNILVSAAAGSGKTSVLTERINRRIKDKEDKVSVDNLLIMTFTKAAAKEMRDRIRNAIEASLDADPDNEDLKKQSILIHNAQITTIHGFCQSIIKDHFEELNIDPNFRVGDDNECKLITYDVCEQLLERFYEEGSEEFLDTVECLATSKNDKGLAELILKLYYFSQSHPNPDEFLDECLAIYSCERADELTDNPTVKDYVLTYTALVKAQLKAVDAASKIIDDNFELEKYRDNLTNDREQIEKLADITEYEKFRQAVKSLNFTNLNRITTKGFGEEVLAAKEKVTDIRRSYKDILTKRVAPAFEYSIEETFETLRACRKCVAMLVELTKNFAKDYADKKREKNIIDYNDMEHMAIDILSNNPEIAAGYRDRFEEIYIDEYQDSNMTQETLVNLIKRVNPYGNLFMVGDVKQSIYRFRQARPDLFLGKFNSYTDDESGSQKVLLNDNFRSRKHVLDAVNEIFESIMTEDVGKIAYDESAKLKYGATFYDDILDEDNVDDEYADNYKAELIIGVDDELTPKELQANIIAGRIKKIIDSRLLVFDSREKGFRPVKYGDIAILVRSLKGWEECIKTIFADRGIPVSVSSTQGYFSTVEVQTVLAFLSVIDNPLQDIELASVMRSPIGNFSNRELAQLRIFNREESLYTNICNADNGSETLSEELIKKCNQMRELIDYYREKAVYTPVYGLIRELIDGRYGSYVRSMDKGMTRMANLDMLINKAEQYAGTSFRGLFNFVRYMNLMRKYEIEDGEAGLVGEDDDVVRVMTIHKSKGLEFPVCFVAGMENVRNTSDEKGAVLWDATYGLGITYVDAVKRTKRDTIVKNLIKEHLGLENVAEEIRVLYVALTRAREKLIMVGSIKKSPEEAENTDILGARLKTDVLSCRSYLDMLALCHARCGGLKRIDVLTATAKDVVFDRVGQELKDVCAREEYLSVVRDFDKAEYVLPNELSNIEPKIKNEGEIDVPAKLSVSELKHMAIDELIAQGQELAPEGVQLFAETKSDHYIPKFMRSEGETKTGGTFYGTAFHRILELWDYCKEQVDVKDVDDFAELMLSKNRMDENQTKAIRAADIAAFLNSPLGKRMYRADKNGMLFREKPFSIGVSRQDIVSGLALKSEPGSEPVGDDFVLVQGIIDAFFIEDNEIVIVDYKTDYVTDEDMLIKRYKPQLEYYAKALGQVTGRKVKELLIYSSRLKKTVVVG